MNLSVSEALATFVADTPLEAVPQATVDRAKASLLHNWALALLGIGLFDWPEKLASSYDATGGASTLLLPAGISGSAELASMVNAAAMHAGSQDDVHTPSTSHPGVVTMPPALALAEFRSAAGRDYLMATILGYEVIGRLGRAHSELATARGFRSSCLFGPFGSAAACARVLGLDPRTTANALGLVANQAAGLAQTFREGTTEWQFQLSVAARSGLSAALAAAAGVPAARHTIEGPAGFLMAHLGTVDHAAGAAADLGQSWCFDEVTIKAFPACAVMQGPLHSLLRLVTKHDIAATDVENINLHLAPFEAGYPGTNNPGPYRSLTATTMSGQFNMALAAVSRRALLSDMYRFEDQRIIDLSHCVQVLPDPTLKIQQSRVTVSLRDGRVFEEIAASGQDTTPSIFSVARNLQPAALERWGSTAPLDRLSEVISAIERPPNLQSLTAALRDGIHQHG